MSRPRGQAGQVLPFVALLLLLVGAASVMLARLGATAAVRARADAAADTAALAGVIDGRSAAEAVAAANGARIEAFERIGADVRVRVTVGPARATARARPVGSSGAGSGDGGLAPAMRAALDAAGRLLGRAVPVTSGYRAAAEQAALWARRALLPYPVAPPGHSMHERGLAVDVPLSFVPTLLGVAPHVGLCRPYPRTDPVHFELCEMPSGSRSTK